MSIQRLANLSVTKLLGDGGPKATPEKPAMSPVEQLQVYRRMTPAGLAELGQKHGWDEVRRYVREMDRLAEQHGLYGDPLWPIS